MTEDHSCPPGSLYVCPTALEVESSCHGGFDQCCDRPDLHVPLPDGPGAEALSQALSDAAKERYTLAAKPAGPAPDLRGGFWPNMTGGLCAVCHIAVNRSEDPEPEHPACTVIHDGMRISTTPARPDEVTLHLPEWTSWDTQAYSAELGIPAGHLPALKAVLDAWLAQQAVDAATHDKETTR